MKKKFTLSICILSTVLLWQGNLLAQQDPMYSQYLFNMLAVNPAYTGNCQTLSATALYRKQWVGIEGAPSTFTFSVDGPIKNQKMALGANIVSDKIGISKTMMINISYAYRIMLVNGGMLSFGLQGGINQYRADYSSVATYYPGLDPPPQVDPAFASSVGSIFPNFGFGTYYNTGKFFAGIGVPKMLKNNLSGTNSPTLDFSSYPNRQNRHIFITAGYTFDLNLDWELKPSLLLKGVHGAPLEMDINMLAWWKQKVGAGLSYRTADAMVAMLQLQVKPEINFGYAYDMTLSKFSGTNSGSHELMLQYQPKAKKMHSSGARFNSKKTSYNKPTKKRKPAYKRKKRRPKMSG